MRFTLREVAKKANVSPMTVTNVLRGRGSEVSETTRLRVLEVVRTMDYIPVRVSMQNRHVATNVMGLVPYSANLEGNEIDTGTYRGLCQSARNNGYDLLVLLRTEAEWEGIGYDARFLDRRTDGFVFVSPNVGEWTATFDLLSKHAVPAVVCYRRDVPENMAWVDPDNEQMMRLALTHLVEMGHRNIAYLRPPKANPDDKYRLANLTIPENWDSLERIGYFEHYTQEFGCGNSAKNVMQFLQPDWQLGPAVVTEIRARKITAIIACAGIVATQLQNICTKAGMRLPQELSLIALEESGILEVAGISSLAFDYSEVGSVAAEVLHQLTEGAEVASVNRVIAVHRKERGSVTTAPRVRFT